MTVPIYFYIVTFKPELQNFRFSATYFQSAFLQYLSPTSFKLVFQHICIFI